MERRNGEQEGFNSVWGSSLSPVSATFLAPMAENHHFNSQQQYFLPGFNEEEQPPLNPLTPVHTPASLLSAFNRLNLSTMAPSTPSPLINRPVVESPLIDPWTIDRGYLIEELNRKNELIRQMQMTQGLKPLHGGFDLPRYNNSSVMNDPYSKFLNGGRGEETGNCTCSSCLKTEVYPKDFSVRRVSNGVQSCYRGLNFDEFDYYNMSRLQLTNNPQFPMLMNPTKFTSLEELKGRLVAVAKDQHGCRFLQKKIEGGRKEDIDKIFVEIKDYISDLMVDQFGNYLVQKLLDTCNGEQRNDILISVTRRDHVFVKICCDMHGTRAVQKLLERLTSENQQARVISALTHGTVVLITDINGHHVVQYCVKHFPIDLKKFLLESVAAHCVEIAMDRSGCCVLQLCVEHSHGEIRERLVAEIISNAAVLAQDPYGNYVVQYLLGVKIPQYTAKLLKQLEGNFVSLSMQKFSSNVVERCLKESNEEHSAQIVKELVHDPDVLKLLQDAFGNYVIQSALSVSFKTPAFSALVDLVKKHDISLRSHPYGKRILACVDQLTK